MEWKKGPSAPEALLSHPIPGIPQHQPAVEHPPQLTKYTLDWRPAFSFNGQRPGASPLPLVRTMAGQGCRGARHSVGWILGLSGVD